MSTSVSLGPKFERFCERFLKHVSGPWAGQPFTLEGWQREWVYELLRVDETGNFVYREALLGIARKNGKTTLLSALALFFLFVMGTKVRGAEVYALAGSMAQARILFGDAKKMLEASPLKDYARISRDTILVPDTGAFFRVLPAGRPELLHGLRPYVFIGDEVHAWDDPELWNAMKTAQIHFASALGIGISTAGFDLNSVLGELFTRGKEGNDPRFYFKWFESSNPEDPKTWKEANPSSWITTDMLQREAKTLPPYVFNRLHLNVWTRAVETWLPVDAWGKCKSDDEIDQGEPIYVGLDFGQKTDHTAVVEVQKKGDQFVTRCTTFATWPDPSKPRPLATNVFEDTKQSHEAVKQFILEINKRNPIQELVYDPAGALYFIESVEEHGIPCVEFPQSNSRMTKATDVLYGVIQDENLRHNGDDVFAAHIAACTVKWVAQGLRLWKDADRTPMDAGIALAIAIDRAHESGSAEFNFWTL